MLKIVWRDFSSLVLRAWVSNVAREEALGTIAVREVVVVVVVGGRSWERRSEKEGSWVVGAADWVGGSAPVKTVAVDSSYGLEDYISVSERVAGGREMVVR